MAKGNLDRRAKLAPARAQWNAAAAAIRQLWFRDDWAVQWAPIGSPAARSRSSAAHLSMPQRALWGTVRLRGRVVPLMRLRPWLRPRNRSGPFPARL